MVYGDRHFKDAVLEAQAAEAREDEYEYEGGAVRTGEP